MNHARYIEEWVAKYHARERNIYVQLDEAHFDALHQNDLLVGVNGGCLDAPKIIPAGGMGRDRWCGGTGVYQCFVRRGQL